MKNKIRILLCSASLERKGGVTNYVRLLLDNYPNDKYVIKHFVQGYNSEFMNIFYPIIFLIQLSKFKEKLKKFNPDIIHFNPSLAWVAIIRDYIFMRYAKKNGFSVLFCVGGWEKSISEHFHTENAFSRFFYKIFMMPDRILVLASSFKKELIELGIDPNKILVITMMVESKKFEPKNKMFDPPYTLLFCSRIEKLKGIYQLLDSFQLILRKYPETKLIYVGQGSKLKNLNKKIYHMQLDRNVKCVGYKSGVEKIDYFHNSDMLILPSFTEGFPNIFCEAMAAGLPFIGTHVGGLVDAFEDGKQGLVIKSMPPTSEEISEKIFELMDNQKLMEKISENNLREAKDKYDVKIVIAKLDNIYQDMFNIKGKLE
jgi:glycosyltransferase involved in cell wall biosynthesis